MEVKSIGALDGDRPRQVSQAVRTLIEQHLSVPADRIHISFADVPGRLRGWKGNTVG